MLFFFIVSTFCKVSLVSHHHILWWKAESNTIKMYWLSLTSLPQWRKSIFLISSNLIQFSSATEHHMSSHTPETLGSWIFHSLSYQSLFNNCQIGVPLFPFLVGLNLCWDHAWFQNILLLCAGLATVSFRRRKQFIQTCVKFVCARRLWECKPQMWHAHMQTWWHKRCNIRWRGHPRPRQGLCLSCWCALGIPGR